MLVCSRSRRLDRVSEAELSGDRTADGSNPQKLDSELVLLNVLLLRGMACKPPQIMLTALGITNQNMCIQTCMAACCKAQARPSDKAGPACSQRRQLNTDVKSKIADDGDDTG